MKTTISPCETSDARITITSEGGENLAAASLWWKDTPLHNGEPIATIGDFHAVSTAATATLLEAATKHLRENGSFLAVGPMDRNTWKMHRFVTKSNGRPPFLLEPENPPEYPDWWRAAGFSELSHYSSSLIPLDDSTTVSPALKKRILSSGISIHNLDPARFEEELLSIHSLSLKSFSNNFLYTPLPEEEFLGAYLKIRAHIDPDFVKIARKDGEIAGFAFGIPDLAASSKPALIVKTLAVDPAARTAGLGSLLVDELHLTGWQKGYTEAIHALQHESNTSLRITGRHHGAAFRRYALLAKIL
jgi:GNAT superfamily N-acetyltransferase